MRFIEKSGHQQTFTISGAVNQGHGVKLSASMTVVECSSSLDECIGISPQTYADGDTGGIWCFYRPIGIECGAAVTYGTYGSLDSAGNVVTRTAFSKIHCYILKTTTGAGQVTKVIPFKPFYPSVFSSKLDDLVANTTTRTAIFTAPYALTILGAMASYYAIPASAAGTVLGQLINYDVSATTEDDLLSADIDLETVLTAKVGKVLTLTATGTDLVLAATDMVFWEVVSNHADATGGTGGEVTIEYIAA